jgi:hypothetical protein
MPRNQDTMRPFADEVDSEEGSLTIAKTTPQLEAPQSQDRMRSRLSAMRMQQRGRSEEEVVLSTLAETVRPEAPLRCEGMLPSEGIQPVEAEDLIPKPRQANGEDLWAQCHQRALWDSIPRISRPTTIRSQISGYRRSLARQHRCGSRDPKYGISQ